MSNAIVETEATAEAPVESTEAYRTLLPRVGRKSPRIPAEVLVRHVLGCVPAEEWPVRFEALEALIRRLEATRRDGLKIANRPAEGHLLGLYATGRRKSDARPYRTVLLGVEPIEGRCDCPDFVRNSLGICKHLLTVLEHIYPRPRLLQRARVEQERARAEGPTGLRWDPIRPLTGVGDWLERVTWFGAPRGRGGPAARARRWFRPGAGGALVLKRSFPDDPPKRLALVQDLLKVLPPAARVLDHDPALRALLVREREDLKR